MTWPPQEINPRQIAPAAGERPFPRLGSGTALHRSWASVGSREERLAFLDDIGGELRPAAGADVLRLVDLPGRDEVDVSRLECHRLLPVDLVLERALEHVDDLFARMRVPGRRLARQDVDDHLDGFAPGDAQVVPLEIGPFGR